MKKMIMIFIAVATVAACNKNESKPEDATPPPALEKVDESHAAGSGLKVALYVEKEINTGYNRLYFMVMDSLSGTPVRPDTLIMFPKMEMMSGIQHSCPNETPVFDNFSDMYKGAASFVMSSGMGTWTVNVTVMKDGKTGTAVLLIDVVDPPEARIFSFPLLTDSSVSYFVSLIQPENPKVGINNFEVLVNHKATMMDWPTVTDVNIAIEPEMPDMGHGSPNNVNPVHTANGHYKGEVNFTMTGWWRVNLTIINAMGDTLTHDRYFDITFQ